MTTSEPALETSFDRLSSLVLVLATARSGSTLLCHDIASLGGLGMPKEYFLGLRREPRTTTATEVDVMERVAMGVRDDAPQVASVKLMVPQSPFVHEALTGRRVPPVEALPAVIEWAQKRFERLMVVFLVRNAIDQAISRVVANATGVFHSSSSDFGADHATVPLQIPDINQQILRSLGRVVRDRQILLDVHRDFADVGLLLTYDDLARRPEETASKLAAHARSAGFEIERDTTSRRLEKVISVQRSTEIREGFIDFLRTETGLEPQNFGHASPVAH